MPCSISRSQSGTNWTFSSFVAMLCKPVRIKHVGWTITSLCGAAVHEDDKKLVRVLIDNGDGIEFNDSFEKAFADAASAGDTSLQFNTELLVGMYGDLPTPDRLTRLYPIDLPLPN